MKQTLHVFNREENGRRTSCSGGHQGQWNIQQSLTKTGLFTSERTITALRRGRVTSELWWNFPQINVIRQFEEHKHWTTGPVLLGEEIRPFHHANNRDVHSLHFNHLLSKSNLAGGGGGGVCSPAAFDPQTLTLSPPAGRLEYCCGRSSPWVTCRIPVSPTRRCWSLSPAEEGWTPRRAARGQCEYRDHCWRLFPPQLHKMSSMSDTPKLKYRDDATQICSLWHRCLWAPDPLLSLR